jgi:hypothetical protein
VAISCLQFTDLPVAAGPESILKHPADQVDDNARYVY